MFASLLPVHFRIDFRALMLNYKSLHRQAPGYLSDLLQFYVPSRSLRSKDLLVVLRSRFVHRDDRVFAVDLLNYNQTHKLFLFFIFLKTNQYSWTLFKCRGLKVFIIMLLEVVFVLYYNLYSQLFPCNCMYSALVNSSWVSLYFMNTHALYSQTTSYAQHCTTSGGQLICRNVKTTRKNVFFNGN